MEAYSDALLNILLVEEVTQHDLYKFCLECLSGPNSCVLILCKDVPPLTNLLARTTKEKLQRLITMQFDSIEALRSKLFLLFEWSIVPSMVVLDLQSFVKLETAAETLQSVCFTIALLGNYMCSVKSNLQSRKKQQVPISITILPKQCVRAKDIQVLTNLYFYKGNVYENTDDVFKFAMERINPARVAAIHDNA